MRLLLLFINFVYCIQWSNAQCALSIQDTIHVECFGENSGGFTLDVGGAISPYSLNLSNGYVQNDDPVFSALYAGNYQVVLVDASLCADTILVKIKQPSKLMLELLCENDNLVATVDGGVRPYSYSWTDETNQEISSDSILLYEASYHYNFEVLDAKNCYVKDSVYVSAFFSLDKIVGDIPFNLVIDNLSTDGSYVWDFGDGQEVFEKSPMHTFEETGQYEVILNVTDVHNCQDQFSIMVDAQGFDLALNDWEEMFNSFSPNNDGVNDEFSFVTNHAITSFEVDIFNRWGKKVFTWTDPQKAWRGQNQSGDMLSEGVYYYKLLAEGKDGTVYEKKGSITLYN